MKLIVLALSIALLIACGDGGVNGTSAATDAAGGALESESSGLIFNSEDWEVISFLSQGLHIHEDVGRAQLAHLGRAVAAFPDAGCSGFLITDDVVATASHCPVEADSTMTVSISFGQWWEATEAHATPAPAALSDGGEAHGRLRLLQLGVSPITAMTVPGYEFMEFSCYHVATAHPDYDAQYWRCLENVIQDDNGLTHRILPGSVWGHIDPAFKVEKNYGVSSLQYNDPSWAEGTNGVLLGFDGRVRDSRIHCDSLVGEKQCFAFTSDTRCGSSGGAVVRRYSLDAIGLIEGYRALSSSDGGCTFDSYESGMLDSLNVGSRFSDLARELSDSSTPPEPTWAGKDESFSLDLVGGYDADTVFTFQQCPGTHYVVGIAGLVAKGEYGNELSQFALICAPQLPLHMFEDAVALTSGGRGLANQLHDDGTPHDYMDFRMGAVVTPPAHWDSTSTGTCREDLPGSSIREFMCPGGFYVEGIEFNVRADDLTGVNSLRCRSGMGDGHVIVHEVPHDFGASVELKGWSLTEYTGCPEGAAAGGMTVGFDDSATRGVALACRATGI